LERRDCFMARFFSSLISRPGARKRKQLRRSRLGGECLEDRRPLSVSFLGPGKSGVASLVGTPAGDQFVVRLYPQYKTMIEFSDDGGATFVDATLSGITAITVSGLEGNDTLTIDASNGLVAQASGLPISFDGGKGHDVLVVEGNPSGTITETF